MDAAAYVIGPREGTGAALAELARALDFASVERHENVRGAEAQLRITPLLFFLCAAVPDVHTLKPIADAIRFSDNRLLRFSPLIYFTPDPAMDTIRLCIKMGFDDVIALPYSGPDLGQRIGRQMGSVQTYYETSTYFGPDRRNRLGNPRSGDSDHGGGEFRRIDIRRNPETGIDVLRDDFQVVI